MLNLLFRELQQCSSLFCAYFKPHDGYFKLTFNLQHYNLQHCLFAVLFAFAPVLFAGMKGMEIKNPRSTAWITIGFDHWIYAGLTTTPV